MPECRFLVDEGALSLDDVPQDEREDSLIALIDQLDALRVSGERVQLLENWGAVECLGGDDVAETMVKYQVLPPRPVVAPTYTTQSMRGMEPARCR